MWDTLQTTDDIKIATERGNKAFGGGLSFAMSQVVLDLQFLTGMFDENSDIRIGQGAEEVINQLGGLDILTIATGLSKIDVEHAACEYRKYLRRQGKNPGSHTYKPNSMGIKHNKI